MSFLIARQPIFDEDLIVSGYELLFRDSEPKGGFDGDRATASVIVGTFLDRKLPEVVGDNQAFINMTSRLLLEDTVELLPPHKVVLEILEDTRVDRAFIRRVRRLAKQGYRFALDDFVWHKGWEPLLELADFVKLDVLALQPDDVKRQLEKLGNFRGQIVAEKVENQKVLERCRKQGFRYFQGFFLSRPQLVPGQGMGPNQHLILRLLALVHEPEVDIRQLATVIRTDALLTFRLLKLVNSAYYRRRHRIESVNQALLQLGLGPLRQWLSVLALSAAENKPPEMMAQAMVRARTCELIAESLGAPHPEDYFLTGLLSLLDAILDMPLARVLEDVPIPSTVQSALLEREGSLHEALRTAVAFEEASWEAIGIEGLDPVALNQHYIDAIQWARQIQKELQV